MTEPWLQAPVSRPEACQEQILDTSKSIALLNKAVADELSAIHQYMYFHFHLDDQGFGPLSMLFKTTSIQEMGHVEKLAERILFLGGDVEMALADPVEKITDPEKILAKAAAMEKQSADDYNQAARECGANADAISKQMFESLVGDEEGHYDEFDRQMEHIRRFGPSYLALQSFGKVPEPERSAE
jgi:bacterioferritin